MNSARTERNDGAERGKNTGCLTHKIHTHGDFWRRND